MTTSRLSPSALGSATETVTTFLPGERYGKAPELFCTMASSFSAFSAFLEGDLDLRRHLAADGGGEVLQVDGLERLAAVGGDFDRIGAGRFAAGLGQDIRAGQIDHDHARLAAFGAERATLPAYFTFSAAANDLSTASLEKSGAKVSVPLA